MRVFSEKKENMVKYVGVLAIALFCSLVCWNPLNAQKAGVLTAERRQEIHTIEDTLAILAYTVLKDSLSENRFAACRNMIPALVRALKVENSFHYPFSRLENVSIQYPADSSFRVITWQLYVNENDYRYYGAIQMNQPGLKLFPLVDRSFSIGEPEQEVLSPEKWYGAVYYNLRQVDGPRGSYYLLFGFDGYEFFRKRKVLEVLSFDRSGKPVFGAPVFVDKDKSHGGRKRLVLEYSAAASVRLNYDEAVGLIIHDHLVEMGGQHNEGPVNLPDGSYEGYRIDKGLLSYVANVWTQTQEEAPRPMPVLDSRKKDIFGKN